MKLNRNVNRGIEEETMTFNSKYYLGVIHGCRRFSNLIKSLSVSTNCGIHLVAIVGGIRISIISTHAETITIDMYNATQFPSFHLPPSASEHLAKLIKQSISATIFTACNHSVYDPSNLSYNLSRTRRRTDDWISRDS